MLRGIVALALAAPLVHGDTYTTKWALYHLDWAFTGHDTQDDFRFKATGIHLEGSSPEDHVDVATVSCSTNKVCSKALYMTKTEVGRSTLPTKLYLPIQVWEDDCGSGSSSVFNHCVGNDDDLFFDFLSNPAELALDSSRSSAGFKYKSFTWANPGTQQAFEAYFTYEWRPSDVSSGCIRLWEQKTATGYYQNYCVSQSVGNYFAYARLVEVNNMFAAVVAADGSKFWVPHDVSGAEKYALPGNVAGSVSVVELYDMYLEPSASEEYVGLAIDGACQSFSANGGMNVHVRPHQDGDDNVFVCVFDGADCTGRRRCWQWESEDMRATNDVTTGLWGMSRGIRSARLVRVASPAKLTFNLVDPALDSSARLVRDSVWFRAVQLVPDLAVSCRGRTQPLASTATADVYVSGSNSMCPFGCVGFQKDGAYVAYDEVEGALTTTPVESRRALFKLHRNNGLGMVVLQLLLDSYDAHPFFLVVDPVDNELALASTPMGDCAYFWTDTTTIFHVGDSMLDTLAREYAQAIDEGSVELAAYANSGRFAQANLLANEFCAGGAGAPLCKVLDLADTAAEAARLKKSSQGTYTDLTIVQYVNPGGYLEAVSDQFAKEAATNELLDAVADVDANLLEARGAIVTNMNQLASMWAASRQDVVQFSLNITGANIASSFQETRTARQALSAALRDDIEHRLVDLGTLALAQQLLEFVTAMAEAYSAMFSVPPSTPFGAANDMRNAATGMVQAGLLSGAAQDAAEALHEVANGIAQAITNLETLQARYEAIDSAYAATSNDDQAPEVQQAYTDFIQAYNDFNGGDIVSAMAAFDYLGAIVDALCDLAGNTAQTLCTELAKHMSLAAGRAAQGIESAYDAAGSMGAYAEQQVEINSLKTFEAQVGVLQAQSTDGLAAFYDVLAVTKASYKVQRLARTIVVHQFATTFCAMQRYNYMGHVTNICENTLTGNELVTNVGEVADVINNEVPSVTRKARTQVLVAGLPVTKGTRSSVSGSVNLVKLMQGEPVAVRLPTDSAWRRRYGWHRAEATSFVKSLKVFVPVGAAGELELSANFSLRQPLYDGDEPVRHNLLETPAAAYRATFASGCLGANPYHVCADLVNLCEDRVESFENQNFAFLPSLNARFELRATYLSGLDGTDFSRVPEGGMVLRVEVELVEVTPFNVANVSSPSSLLSSVSAEQGCCTASGHVVDWLTHACTPCPEGSSSASSMGIYCQ